MNIIIFIKMMTVLCAMISIFVPVFVPSLFFAADIRVSHFKVSRIQLNHSSRHKDVTTIHHHFFYDFYSYLLIFFFSHSLCLSICFSCPKKNMEKVVYSLISVPQCGDLDLIVSHKIDNKH